MAPAVKFKIKQMIDNYIHSAKVMIFSKSYCPACLKAKQLFESLGVAFTSIELDQIDNGAGIQEELASMTGMNTVPNVFINGKHTGGCDDTVKLHSEGKLMNLINPPSKTHDYDLIVIGGGSGGLAASKEAARLGKKVAVCDFVRPSPKGTTWGLGGTCVNVGCIPKKLMHQAAILSHEIHDSKSFGWELLHEDSEVSPVHKWNNLVMNIQNYIGSLNWGYKVALRSNNVTYLNAFATFIDSHKIKTVDNKGKENYITSERFILAMGGRPKYPENVPGAVEYGITSDDLFSLNYCPGKVLLVGASYISLECAGFLRGLGCDVTVMVRSILLRGFDQQIANLIGDHMESVGIKFNKECVPIKIEEVRPSLPGVPGMFKVSSSKSNGDVLEEEFNTVIFAVGREPCTQSLGLDIIGLKVNPKNGKIITNDHDQTSIENIYAIGDVLDGKPELTPMAIQSGVLLARRLFGSSTLLTDYNNVPTTVFTPLEYGCCGMSEEAALEKYGPEDIEVYHSNFKPLEFVLSNRDSSACYAKLVCVKSLENLVVGIHYLGPNAGEVIQGYSLGLKLGAKKSDFDNLVGIHPTTAEVFTTLTVTKASGEGILAAGC